MTLKAAGMRHGSARWVAVMMACGVFAAACGPVGGVRRSHPDDVEQAAPHLSSGVCDEAAVVSVETLASSSPQRPAEGDVIAVEGRPSANLVCTAVGCAMSCCNNACGYAVGCAYELRKSGGGRLCLDGEDFACGGTDCSAWCSPFSKDPQHGYRFVGEIVYRDETSAPRLIVDRFCRLD